MNESMLTVSNSEFGKLDILIEDGKELFPANDCARVLGYNNPKDAIARHCRWVVKRDLPHPQSASKRITVNFITEGDLYRLIIRSRLPSAQKFEKWLFDEVLPQIRKTGGYRARPSAELPHLWLGIGAILAEDTAKRLGVKKDKIRDLLKSRPTVYVRGVDWDSLTGYELGEYKFYNRVVSTGKGLIVIYESGWRKLRWELLGEGTPETALPMPAAPLLLPAAVQAKNERMERGLEQIAKVMKEIME